MVRALSNWTVLLVTMMLYVAAFAGISQFFASQAAAVEDDANFCVEIGPNLPDCVPPDGCVGVENVACEDFGEGNADRHYERFTPNVTETRDQFENESICSDEEIENGTCDCNTEILTAEDCDIVAAAEAGVNILTITAGLAVVGGIMYGSYLYMISRDNPGQIAAARSRITWAVIALLILVFFWGLLQWLIPGGLL